MPSNAPFCCSAARMMATLCWWALAVSMWAVSESTTDAYLFDIDPAGIRVLLSGSLVAFQCSPRPRNSALDRHQLPTVGLLFTPAVPDTADQFLPQTGSSSAAAVVHLVNVSHDRHSGWYQCAVMDSQDPLPVSNRTRLLIGSAPVASGLDFFWIDRLEFHSAVRPSLLDIQQLTGVPPELGGRLVQTLTYTKPDGIGFSQCNCHCNQSGYCEWNTMSDHMRLNLVPYNIRINFSVCNQLHWCYNRSIEFDMRDAEQPLAVRYLEAASLGPHWLNATWRPPTTEIPGNQEYRYELLLSDGRALATNDTDASVRVRPDRPYTARIRCRPRHFSGHWSPWSSELSVRTPEWLPCNPGLGLLFPQRLLVFPASDADCANGRVLAYRVRMLDSNYSQLIAANSSDELLFAVLDAAFGFNGTAAAASPLRIGISASTSAGENLTFTELTFYPGNGASVCDGRDSFLRLMSDAADVGSDLERQLSVGDKSWDVAAICVTPAMPLDAVQSPKDCGRLDHVRNRSSIKLMRQSSSDGIALWLVRGGVACPDAVRLRPRLIGLESVVGHKDTPTSVVVVSIVIVVIVVLMVVGAGFVVCMKFFRCIRVPEAAGYYPEPGHSPVSSDDSAPSVTASGVMSAGSPPTDITLDNSAQQQQPLLISEAGAVKHLSIIGTSGNYIEMPSTGMCSNGYSARV